MMDELVANLLEAYRRNISALDWMTEETKQRAYDKLDDVPAQDRLPREVPRLLRARGARRRPARQRARRVGVRDRPRSSARSARRSTATSGSCCRRRVNAYYNPGINEICFPAGDPAEAVLRRRRRPGRELRRHRRGHRPRDRPRLRRPGLAVRRRRATSTTGGPPTTRPRSRSAPTGADRAVRRLRAARPARRARQRRAHRRREHRRPRRHHHRASRPTLIASAQAVRGRRPHRRASGCSSTGRYVLAHQAPQGAGAAVADHRPAQPAGVPRQHRAQPRRVPRGLRRTARATASGSTPDRASASGSALLPITQPAV